MIVRKRETFEANQWYPGKKIPGVQGSSNKWCGCIIAGGTGDIPHIHSSISECDMLMPGDWVVIDKKGKPCIVKPEIFNEIYEEIK